MILKRYFCLSFYLACISLFGITACQSSSQKKPSVNPAESSAHFSEEVHAQYAKGFSISYHTNYKLLEILNPFQNRVDTLRYALIPRELADEVEVPGAREISIPIRSMIATSTTHLGLAELLDATDIITGMVGADYVYNSAVRKKIDQGDIASFPMGEFNKEEALNLQPEVLMISGGQSSQFDNYKVLMESGISVLVNSEWLETTPLGKAEWVKVLAALLNKEKLANERFSEVAHRYNSLKNSVETLKQKPLVVTNISFKGAWFVPGGDSYNATIIRDAGADYPWSESAKTGGLRKDFEVMYQLGLKADVWINPGAAKSKDDLLTTDSRLKDFKPFKTGEIYNNNRRMSSSGGNDFWESGVVHPDRILADLVKIFHPEVVPDHPFYYYQKLQ